LFKGANLRKANGVEYANQGLDRPQGKRTCNEKNRRTGESKKKIKGKDQTKSGGGTRNRHLQGGRANICGNKREKERKKEKKKRD